MGKLGVEDVEEWLKLTDKDGVKIKFKFYQNEINFS